MKTIKHDYFKEAFETGNVFQTHKAFLDKITKVHLMLYTSAWQNFTQRKKSKRIIFLCLLI